MLEERLRQGFAALGLPLDGEALERCRVYYEELEKTNAVMNLTAITGEEDVARLHFLDCAALLTAADFAGRRVLDVGTGAGFPGLVLKIACPETELTLLDSLDKRVGFLRATCEKLGFDDVACVHARAEEIPAGFREAFERVTSRAVARLNLLCELCLPYVHEGGYFLAMKGAQAGEELTEAAKAIRTLGGSFERTETFEIGGAAHTVVVIRKTAHTPPQYPRAWSRIKQKPL